MFEYFEYNQNMGNSIIQPNPNDSQLATRGLAALRSQRNARKKHLTLDQLEPNSAVTKALEQVLKHFARGESVTFTSQPLEKEILTTQEAANWLSMSRPHFVRLLEHGKLPFHKVGNQRRVSFADVKTFQKNRREAALNELTALSQEMGLYNL
jgi:excisionase family DNA binding protein